MRIAIATDWFPPRRGGIEAQLSQLAAGLAQRGHSVDVITATPGPNGDQGYRVRRLATTLFPKLQVAISPGLFAMIREAIAREYDVVHAHVSVVSPVGYLAAATARSLGLPTVVTFHSVLRHKRHLLRLADGIAGLSMSAIMWTAVSRLVAAQVGDALDGVRVGVLSNGIDLGFWRGASRSIRNRGREGVTLISAMRLHSKKRPRELLTGFAHAATRARVPAVLRIVGDGPELNALQRDIRALGLEEGIARAELLGWQPPERLRELYTAADAFVLASEREAFGIAALEAAAAGLPVIAMTAAGCREFLDGESGLLCRDDAELATVLARFMTNPKREPNVRSTVPLETYDWSSVLAKHEEVYQLAITRAAAPVGAA